MATARISASIISIPAAGQARTGTFVYGNAEPQAGGGLLIHRSSFPKTLDLPPPTPKPKAAPKPSPAAPALQAPPLEDLFSALHRHTRNFEYDQVVKIADQVLAVAPGDEDALWCKVVALIKSEVQGCGVDKVRCNKALLAIATADRLSIDLGFYKCHGGDGWCKVEFTEG